MFLNIYIYYIIQITSTIVEGFFTNYHCKILKLQPKHFKKKYSTIAQTTRVRTAKRLYWYNHEYSTIKYHRNQTVSVILSYLTSLQSCQVLQH